MTINLRTARSLIFPRPQAFTRAGLLSKPFQYRLSAFTSFGGSLSTPFGTSATMASEITPVLTKDACPPAGPYTLSLVAAPSNPDMSQAVKIPGLIFVSGQMPADSQGNLVGGSIAEQTEAVFKNIRAIVEAAGSSMERVVKVNVFLDDMANFAEMNEVYAKHFPHKPARSTVAVKTLPKNIPVEIECIALP